MTTETNPEIESPNLTASALIDDLPIAGTKLVSAGSQDDDRVTKPISVTAETVDVGAASGTPKPGRGPTRSGVKFGDLLDDLGEMPQEDREELLDALRGGATAKSMRALAKSERQTLKEHVADKQAEIDAHEAQAELLARIETLSPLHRAALVKTLEPPVA